MKMVLYLDALSLWCLLGARAVRTVSASHPDIACEWRIPAIRDGQPLGLRRAQEAYFFERCEALTGVRLTADWLEDERTGAYAANAVLQAAKLLGARSLDVPLRLMEAAMVEGREAFRGEVAAEVCGQASGIAPDRLLALAGTDTVRAAMEEGQSELRALGMDQRPTLVIENAIPDRAVLMGVWAEEAIAPLCAAMLRDERRFLAFNAAHPFPA